MPFGFDLANQIIAKIEYDVENNAASPLCGDAKTQVTVDLSKEQNMSAVQSVLVSVCHKKGVTIEEIRKYIANLINLDCRLLINPAGTWTLGGAHADCGLTGRKIVCDQYGGYVPVGGGAFSGKDPTKVDRSGAYLARKIAADIVREFGVSSCSTQLAYAIGVAEPVSLYIKSDLSKKATESFVSRYNLTPQGIIEELNLLNLDYEHIAEGCHFRKDWWA